jgi:basic amino acid/polyamine antiporter, APA family
MLHPECNARTRTARVCCRGVSQPVTELASRPPLAPQEEPERLVRGISLRHATALNMIDMIGVGPFITLPLIVAAMHGPQAMLGWVLGALLVMCDGLVWAELGAMFPQAGGPIRYLREMYGPTGGRFLAFLFVWQLTFSAPLSIASGCIGFAQYAGYLWPSLGQALIAHDSSLWLPGLGRLPFGITVTKGTFVAMGAAVTAVILLYRRVAVIGRLAALLWVGVMGTTAWIIVSGLLHFDAARAFAFPPGAFHLDHAFFTGLGAAMLIAVYDYWGYYNVCYLGSEIADPGRTIPRAILLSIAGVAVLYISMNLAVLGTMPWTEVAASKFVISEFMQRVWGPWAASVVTLLMLWTAFASVFSLLMGYSRIPYAAAREGEYFPVFARIHPKHRIPHVSLLVLGANAVVFCLFRLADVVTALVVIRLFVQFLAQTVGVIVLRQRDPDRPRPFRMWLYPLPAVLAFLGFVYVLVMRPKSLESIRVALAVAVVGAILYFVRHRLKPSSPVRSEESA